MQVSADPNSVGVDIVSLSVVRLEMLVGEMTVAVGSAFPWSAGDHTCLVTAWHNLTGTHPATGKSLAASGARPDRVRAHFKTAQVQTDMVLHVDLYDPDGSARWLVHPAVGEAVDVAIIPIPGRLPPAILGKPIDSLESSNMATPVGMDAFIVGFPKGLAENGLPIWKRASIATEPKLFADEPARRRVLVDSASREGMSGAPVFARTLGAYVGEHGGIIMDKPITMRFVGLYSGRLAAQDSLDAQLGIVWPAPLITRIVKEGVVDTFERDGSFVPKPSDA